MCEEWQYSGSFEGENATQSVCEDGQWAPLVFNACGLKVLDEVEKVFVRHSALSRQADGLWVR